MLQGIRLHEIFRLDDHEHVELAGRETRAHGLVVIELDRVGRK